MKKILQYLQSQARSITILGGFICLLSFTVYYIAAWYKLTSIVGIWSLGAMFGISITFLGIGLNEENVKIRNLLFYPISWFFGILFFTYIANMYFDLFLETNKMNLTYILTLVICFIYYLRR